MRARPARPTDFGRAGGVEALIERHQAAERRLSSSLRQAESVDSALRALDQQLADVGEAEKAEILRASARALLVVAFRQENYDVTLLPTSSRFALRVRNTTAGLLAEVTEPDRAGDSKDNDEGEDSRDDGRDAADGEQPHP